ncbi:MAG: hypothetical protein QXE31_02235, partial [Candidatus Woesearchaeota archaeon]
MKITKLAKILLVLVVVFVFLFNVKADLMALQGTVDNPSAQDIRIYIYDSPIGGTLIYDSGTDFNNAIKNGRYDILLGSNTPLTLEYGKLYYLDISINGEDLDFNGSERQVFQSSVGKIKGNYINNSAISSVHILDGSISGVDIADDSIEKTKIQTIGQWQENEIPSLTASWTGTINASKIISTNLLNVNSSITANNALIANSANTLQGFSATIFFSNDTMLYEKIENTNTTLNIKKLGFNTTAELDTRYALIGTSSGGNSTEQIQNAVSPMLSTYANQSWVISQGYASSNLLSTYWNKTEGYNTLSTYTNKSLVYSILSTYANTSDVLSISTLYNTLTTYLNKSEAYTTLSTYANQSWVISQGYLTTESDNLAISKLSTYWNKSDAYTTLSNYINQTTLYNNILYAYANQSWAVNNFIQQGTKLGNSTQEIQAVYYPTLATYTNNSQVYALLSTYSNTSLVYNLLSTYANTSDVLALGTLYNTLATYLNKTDVYIVLSTYLNATDQRFNETTLINNLNTTANIKKLGFNTTAELDNRFIQQGTKLGNTTQEIQAVYYPTLSSYANTTQVYGLLSTYSNTTLVYSLLSTYLNATDQRFNDTIYISNVNRTENIKKLGFNTTSELDTRYIQQGTKLGNSTQEIQAVYYPTLSTYLNQTTADSLYQQKTNLRVLLFDDFTYWTTARTEGIGLCAALNAGTAASATVADMYGAVSFSDSTTANGGYYCATNTAIMRFRGNETFTFRFRPNTNTANYIFDAGFEDSTTAADPTDGCWLKSTNLVIQGLCRSNSVQTGTASTYTLTSGITYVGKIQVNADAT